MVIDMEGVGAHIDRIAQDWSDGVDQRARLASEADRCQAPRR
jgi:hypothetical protein